MPGQSTRKVDGGRIPGIAEIQNCIEIVMRFTAVNLKQGSVRTYGQNEGAFIPSAAMANQLFLAISNHWLADLGQYMYSISFDNLSVRDMTSSINPAWVSTVPAVQSNGTPSALPPDVALVLTANQSERHRGANGRLYMFGWNTVADGGNGQASTNAKNALTLFGTHLLQELNAVALSAAVAKPARQEYIGLDGALHPQRNAHMSQVLSYSCRDAEWDTQRRRGL
jgi:hypothetical protein